jgi:hypothetical protein
MFCPNCGSEQVGNPKFCRRCGAKLDTIERVREEPKLEVKKEEIISPEEERIFQEMPPLSMKKLVIEAAKLTNKYGLTAYSLAWGGRLKFKDDTMGIAVGRVMASKGGTGGKVVVTASGTGSKVRLTWEKDNEKCQRIGGLFWKNLEALLQPGGLKSGPSSAALKWGTGLLFALTAYYFLVLFVDFANLQEGYETFIFPGDFVWPFLALFAAIHAARRKHWGYVRTITILLPIATVLGMVIYFSMLQGVSSSDADVFLSVLETVIVLLIEITCAILISKSKEDFL